MAERAAERHASAGTGYSVLTPEQSALLPTDEDVVSYREHGYYLSGLILTEEEIAAALGASERFYVGDVTDPAIEALERYRPIGAYGEGLRKHDYSSFFRPELATLACHVLIGAVAARLTGSPSIRLWHDQLLYKPPVRQASVGWHTDRQYWLSCTSDEMLTAWIPFHDCPPQMGAITFIDGSHRWPDNSSGLDFFSHDLERLEQGFDSGGRPVVKSPMSFWRGQVSFHNCRVIHGSGPNSTEQPRRSIAVHLQDEANRYREFRREDGHLAHHGNDALCRKVNGMPDYTDPAVFPLLFRAG